MTPIRRIARWFLVAHAVLITASVLAFFLVVGKPVPPGFDPVLWTRIYGIGMTWTGPLYIITGFVAALAGLLAVTRWRRAVGSAAIVIVLSLAIELLGTSTGIPFGAYGYDKQLGWRVFGLVPAVIPLSWFLMLYASLGIAVRITARPGRMILLAATGLVAWDALMDPTMSAVFPFWSWHTGGVYYGMPLLNWFGWFITGLVIATAAVRLDHEGLLALRQEPLPVVLYLCNGLFPLALAIKAGLVGVILVGGVAMLGFVSLPAVAAAWRRRTVTERRTSLRQA